jgi:hypothetical protein
VLSGDSIRNGVRWNSMGYADWSDPNMSSQYIYDNSRMLLSEWRPCRMISLWSRRVGYAGRFGTFASLLL